MRRRCRLPPPARKMLGRSSAIPQAGHDLFPGSDIRWIGIVSCKSPVQLSDQFVSWLRLDFVFNKLVPKAEDQLKLVIHGPRADSFQGWRGVDCHCRAGQRMKYKM